MKVAYFSDSLPPNMDGVVKTLCHLIDTLENEEVDYQFWSPFKPRAEEYSWSDRVHEVSSVPLFLYDYYRVSLPYFDGVGKRLDSYQPDLVHVVSPSLLGL